MQRTPRRLSLIILAATASVLLAACGQRAAAPSAPPKPATLEKIAGTSLARITLTEDGARAIDLRTEPVAQHESGLAVPYGALVYDKAGDTWVYAATGPLAFVRQRISVDAVRGNLVVARDGPPPGTQVVTVGVAELYGVEFGVGK